MLLDAGVDHPAVQRKIGDGAVPVARSSLRREDGVVDLERPPGIARQHRHEAGEALAVAVAADERRGDDGAGVDHRVERALMPLVEDDRVEGVAAGLDAHLAEHLLASAILEGEPIDEGLRDRLDGERAPRVAGLVRRAVGCRERNAEQLRICLRELRDIRGHPPAIVAPVPIVDLAQRRQDRGGPEPLHLAIACAVFRTCLDRSCLHGSSGPLAQTACHA